MPTHVALLRGINVGGRNRVAMAALREVVEGLGHTEVATWIQSGNVVFTSAEADPATLAASLERAIGDQLGVRPRVVVRTCRELARVVADNPFPEPENPRLLHAVFWSGPLGPEDLAAVAAAQQRSRELGSRDEARVVGATLYLHTPDGFGGSALAAPLTRMAKGRPAGAAGTARNWATVGKLLAMCRGPGTIDEKGAAVRIGSVVVDCTDFATMVDFWREALHYVTREPAEDGWVILRDPGGGNVNVSIQQVPEPRLGKNRLHFDLYTDDQAGEVERLLALGAARYPREPEPDDDFVVLEDPEGNLFCVVDTGGAANG